MKKFLSIFFLNLFVFSAHATHNRAGEILYKRIAPFTNVVGSTTVNVYTYSITVIKYTDDGPGVADRCVDTVYFGDGTRGIAPRINGLTNCSCGTLNGNAIGCGVIILNTGSYKVKYNVYSIIHTYPGAGSYLIRTFDPNRNQGIHNIPNSVNLPFYIESYLVINSVTGANSSPILSNPPIAQGVVGSCYFHNPCAYDLDGDSLSYEITTCRAENGQTIQGYFYPETGGGNFNINPTTGLLSWCTPQYADQYNIAFLVKEWRKNGCNGSYSLIGYVLRDMQILTYAVSAGTFSSTGVGDTCISAGAVVSKHVFTSSNYQPSLSSLVTTFTNSPATLSLNAANGTIDAAFSWQTNCSHVRKNPYDINLVFTYPGFPLQKFYKQFRVTVLPPTPTLYQMQVDTGKVTLTWFPANNCLTNLAGYKIYRKVGGAPPVLGNNCGNGFSPNSGFALIGSAPSGANSFVDNNVWPIPNGSIAHYVVTAVTDDCLESSSANLQTVTLIVGINENTFDKNLKVYPNPFSNKLTLEFGDVSGDKTEIKVFANDGRLVYSDYTENTKGIINLDVDTLNPGIYLLSVKTKQGVAHRKLIKQ